MAVPAADGLPERVRGDAGPRRRPLPARARGRARAGRPPLPPRHDGAGDELGHARGLDHRPRRPPHRPLAPRGRPLRHPPARAHGLRRRPRPPAHRPLRQRPGAGRDGVRADVRLRPRARVVGVRERRLPRDGRPRARRRRRAAPHDRPEHRHRGPARHRAPPHEGRRGAVLRAVVERALPAAHDRRGRRGGYLDRPSLAALARPRQLPRPPVALRPPAQRAHAQGADLRAHRGDRRRAHDLAPRDARAASATGTTATPGSATPPSRSGASTRSASTGRRTTSSTSSPT